MWNQQQIPFGNDSKKSKSKRKSKNKKQILRCAQEVLRFAQNDKFKCGTNSRFPLGMTARKARANARARTKSRSFAALRRFFASLRMTNSNVEPTADSLWE